MEWLDILTDRFPDDAIKSRQGRGGKNYSYLDTPSVIARLNVAFGGSWSFEVLGHWILDNEVVVQGKLTGNGITKEQFGESETERFSEGHKNAGRPLSIGDDLKSATSDCLKKCATLFGVGLEQLYTGKPPGGNGEGGQPPQKSGPAGEKQIGFIESLLKRDAIPQEVKDRAQAAIAAGMDRAQASASIDALQDIIKAANPSG